MSDDAAGCLVVLVVGVAAVVAVVMIAMLAIGINLSWLDVHFAALLGSVVACLIFMPVALEYPRVEFMGDRFSMTHSGTSLVAWAQSSRAWVASAGAAIVYLISLLISTHLDGLPTETTASFLNCTEAEAAVFTLIFLVPSVVGAAIAMRWAGPWVAFAPAGLLSYTRMQSRKQDFELCDRQWRDTRDRLFTVAGMIDPQEDQDLATELENCSIRLEMPVLLEHLIRAEWQMFQQVVDAIDSLISDIADQAYQRAQNRQTPPQSQASPDSVEDALNFMGLDWDSLSESKLKKTFRRLSKQYHPDRPGGSHEMMQALNEAYQILSEALQNNTCHA